MSDFTITLTGTQTLALTCCTVSMNEENATRLDDDGNPYIKEMKEAEVATYLVVQDLQDHMNMLQARTEDLFNTILPMNEEQRKIILEGIPPCAWKLWLVARLNSKEPNEIPYVSEGEVSHV